MSTQDDTLYLRSRLAERRGKPDYGGPGGQWSSPPQFLKDGFQKWAESTRPAREGGAEKIGCEKQMPRRHGAGAIEDAAKIVSDMTDFYQKAKEYTPRIKATLRDKTVQQAIAKGKYANTMEKIATYMEKVGLGHMRGDADMVRRVGGSKSFKDWAREEMAEESHGGRIGMGNPQLRDGGRIGMGRHSIHEHMEKCLEGGMSASEALESLKKYGKQVYDWLKANKNTTKAVLTSKYLNEDLGTDIPRKIKGYMEMIGLGHDKALPVGPEVAGRLNRRGRALPGMDFEACPPGYIDDGLTCRKDAKASWNAKKHKGAFGEDIGGLDFTPAEIQVKKRKGSGRQGGAYAQFVREFAAKHPGPDLMRRAADAWKSR
jgi:hypothetical protein